MKIRTGIIGATGYVGIELVRLLQQHPKVQICYAATGSYAGQAVSEVYPHLKNFINLDGQAIDIEKIIADCDLIFLALPHDKVAEIAAPLLSAGKKVIDTSAYLRLRNPADFKQWYQHEPAPMPLLKQAIYGLPELGHRDDIAKANLIANPGCYPTAILLGAMPTLTAGIVDPTQCIFDAKSGISGAGRAANLRTHFCEISENFSPYQLAGAHRHTPEIEQELSGIAKQKIQVQFTPHLLPIVRGLLVTAYFKLTQPLSAAKIRELYVTAYKDETFIRIAELGEIPQTKNVKGSNFCDIGIFVDERTQRLIVISAIDNLIKGAAGQAIQNMNLMFNFPETTGLMQAPIYP